MLSNTYHVIPRAMSRLCSRRNYKDRALKKEAEALGWLNMHQGWMRRRGIEELVQNNITITS